MGSTITGAAGPAERRPASSRHIEINKTNRGADGRVRSDDRA